MLTRVITALVLAPVVILLTLFLPTEWFGAVLLIVILSGLYEWNRLTAKSQPWFAAMAILVSVATWWLTLAPEVLISVSVLTTLFWLYQLNNLARHGLSNQHVAVVEFVIGAVVLFGAWCALILLHQQSIYGPETAVAVMAIVWAADSCAYFSGKSLGRNKLAPELSPNKTIEGLLGGVVGSCLVAILFALVFLQLNTTNIVLWLSATILAVLISVVGDLYQSRLKRIAGVKDSGSLLPGHGGVLDRIDGLIAAIPAFASVWYWAI